MQTSIKSSILWWLLAAKSLQLLDTSRENEELKAPMFIRIQRKNNACIFPYIGISTSTSVAKGNIWLTHLNWSCERTQTEEQSS